MNIEIAINENGVNKSYGLDKRYKYIPLDLKEFIIYRYYKTIALNQKFFKLLPEKITTLKENKTRLLNEKETNIKTFDILKTELLNLNETLHNLNLKNEIHKIILENQNDLDLYLTYLGDTYLNEKLTTKQSDLIKNLIKLINRNITLKTDLKTISKHIKRYIKAHKKRIGIFKQELNIYDIEVLKYESSVLNCKITKENRLKKQNYFIKKPQDFKIDFGLFFKCNLTDNLKIMIQNYLKSLYKIKRTNHYHTYLNAYNVKQILKGFELQSLNTYYEERLKKDLKQFENKFLNDFSFYGC